MVDRLRGRAGVARRDRILLRDCFTCRLCGRTDTARNLRVDHITPLAKGGSDTDDRNLRTLCVPCHDTVTREEFGHVTDTAIGSCGVDGMPTDPRHPWNAP